MSDNIDISSKIEKNIENDIRNKIENEIKTGTESTKSKYIENTKQIESLRFPGNNEKITVKMLEVPYKRNSNKEDRKENDNNRNYHAKCELDNKVYLMNIKDNILKKMTEELKNHHISKDASIKEENLKVIVDKTFEIRGKLWTSAPKKYRINGNLPTIFNVKLLTDKS